MARTYFVGWRRESEEMWLVCERTWQNLLYYSHVQFHSSIDHKHPLNTYKQDRVVIHWPKTKTKVNSAFIDQMTTCFYRSIHVMGYILKWSNHYRYIQVFLNPFISHRAPVTPCKLTPAPVYTPWLASLVPVHCLGLWKAPWQVGRPDVWPPAWPSDFTLCLMWTWKRQVRRAQSNWADSRHDMPCCPQLHLAITRFIF